MKQAGTIWSVLAQVDGSDEKVLPMMTTADMSMKVDPEYNKICKSFLENPEIFEETFAISLKIFSASRKK